MIVDNLPKGTWKKWCQAWQLEYLHGPGVDQPLVKRDETTGKRYFYYADVLGSVRYLTDESGKVVNSYRYDAFGDIVSKTEGIENSFTFTGREWEPALGLYYYRNRWYDPKVGRFLSEDPIGFGGGINFYAYVGNNPVNWVDPWGLYRFTPGAHGPLTPGLDANLRCFEQCVGHEAVVTSGQRGTSGPHGAGNACDLGENTNPAVTPDRARACYTECFNTTSSYAQEENKPKGRCL